MRRDDDDGWPGLLLPGPGEPNPWSLAARAVLVAFLAMWTLGFLRHGLDALYLMLGQFKWVYAFRSPVGGSLADRFGRRPTICGSIARPVYFLRVVRGSAFAHSTPWDMR